MNSSFFFFFLLFINMRIIILLCFTGCFNDMIYMRNGSLRRNLEKFVFQISIREWKKINIDINTTTRIKNDHSEN